MRYGLLNRLKMFVPSPSSINVLFDLGVQVRRSYSLWLATAVKHAADVTSHRLPAGSGRLKCLTLTVRGVMIIGGIVVLYRLQAKVSFEIR